MQEFLKPMGITQLAFAEKMGVPIQRINSLIKGRRAVTADTAWKLADALDTTPQFWMNLQTNYDLWMARQEQRKDRAERREASARDR